MTSAATRDGPAGSRRGWAVGGLALAMGLLLTGCSLIPEPKADPTRYYVLTTATAAPASAGGLGTLQLRPVEVAGYLRNPAMVVRRGEHEIEFRDVARWGEPLELGIARVLGEELRARGVPVSSTYTESVRATFGPSSEIPHPRTSFEPPP